CARRGWLLPFDYW
nr:immunoglobulin heavy chain junction region [Mus musculus]